ncbi:S9 family peptidase [Microbacterium dextranolyticum]|uniref:Acyl-peptide hydrolase n=1 Tax=Microbacterium dextranolyticum TaxID=36806 RepID=A0A9W6HPX5_9MICO|nr:prolyl oligopeptidase family serine peptidase [Microbacterium dextranolyticum]MBM7462436.1 dipeptidyl aminopeptidase/acylaminoacyl peptidase [Microbacterium dextranolyticum]GLJ96731.1 acyl-peptide hydrolase [Microbacterium dextranolyticum]
MVSVHPFGSWPSPLSAQWASSAAPRFEGAAFVGDEIWWGESLPAEGGRTTVRRRTAAGTVDTVLPSPWSARSRVHEYGGGAWTATETGILLFVEKTDQRVWALGPDGVPRALTPEDPAARYGGLRRRHGALLAVLERGTDGIPHRAIVRIAIEGPEPRVTELVSGSDFVAQPDLSPDGTRLAWVAWDHPHMPWERTEVRVGVIENGRVADARAVTSGETSALQPTWRTDDELVVIDEPTGRWNLWSVEVGADDGPSATLHPLAPADADTGGGLWVLGQRWYGLLGEGRLAAIRTNGTDALVIVDSDGTVTQVALPASSRLAIDDARPGAVLVSGAGRQGTGIWLVTADGEVARVAGADSPEADWMPVGRPVTFAGPHGEVHAYDFAPTHPDVRAPEGELPPYVVFVHGGPTAHVGGIADAKTAFFTSRGIGVLDVNYGGSTGYGRAYRERLDGQWGIVDVDDVAAAASGLASAGRADEDRLAIEGGSAGGWTVLGALVRTDVFRAGISRYGVGDARALAEDTHDFEAHYLDGLIGPLPDAEALYVERSPLSHPDRLRAPMLILQGSDDAVVPPAQAEAIRDALATRHVPHAYVLYDGEGHGFRRAESIVDALEKEVAFLGAVFGFDTPGIPPLPLD